MFNWLKRLLGFNDDKLELANKLSKPVKHRFKDKTAHPRTQNEERLEKLAETWFHLGGAGASAHRPEIPYQGLPHGYDGGNGGLGCGCPGQNGGYQPNQTRLDTSNPPGNPPKKL